MRITKRIEQYIRDNLNKQYDETGVGLEEAANAERKERIGYASGMIAAMQGQLIARFPYLDGHMETPEEIASRLVGWRYTRGDCSPAEQDWYKFNKEKHSIVEAKLNEIIITMELGGTKEDLDRMMADAFKKNPDE